MDNKKKEDVVEALSECFGIVTDACRKSKVPRSTYYKWLNEDDDFRKAVADTQEEAIDFVEGKLFQKINGVQVRKGTTGEGDEQEDVVYDLPPSDTAIIFYLKTKAKKRGYVERTELTGVDGQPVIWNEVKTYKPELNGNGTHVKANGSL